MARAKSRSEAYVRPSLTVSREEARSRIRAQLERGEEVPNASVNENDEARRWYDFTTELLRQLFTTDELRDEFTGASSFSFGGDITTGAFLRKLRSIYERLDLIPEPSKSAGTGAIVGPRTEHPSRSATDVFVVHGHDEAAREGVARFLERLGLTAIVLHEQPNSGRHIMEKLERHKDVDFAVVLLTPDDVGAGIGEQRSLKLRARQNVILELGYFLGALGRPRVCVLYKGKVELPSDYHGIVYISMDESSAWQLPLARELRNANFQIDFNKLG
jgi:predicted nucleotide-binding protein